jgi:hypothetical protein
MKFWYAPLFIFEFWQLSYADEKCRFSSKVSLRANLELRFILRQMQMGF